MENTFVVNEEPITIKITIEVIPAKKKENTVKLPVDTPPNIVPSPEGWNVIEPETPPVEPIVTPEKKKRTYTRKAKTTEDPPVEEKKPESIIDEKPAEAVPTKVETKPAPTSNKVVARLAQMIRFYCKASNIPTTEVTKKYLIDHGAADIIEGATDEDIEEAFKEVVKK